MPVLYGGSVSEANASDYALLPEVGGLFIGRAAWDPNGYLRIYDAVSAVIRHRTS